MSHISLTVEQILPVLTTTPSRIAEFTGGLTEAQLHADPSPGEWSANDVLAHLRSCADVWGSSIVTILNQHRPTIRAVNPRTWIKSTNYLEQDFQSSLEAFTVQRVELLAVLKSLKPKDWSHFAIVTGAGKALELTVQSYAQRMAVHERPHLQQITRIASMIQQ